MRIFSPENPCVVLFQIEALCWELYPPRNLFGWCALIYASHHLTHCRGHVKGVELRAVLHLMPYREPDATSGSDCSHVSRRFM